MELNKNLTNTNRGKGMKTFKQHIKEGISDKTYGVHLLGVQTTNLAIEDSVIGVHKYMVDVLKVNGYCWINR